MKNQEGRLDPTAPVDEILKIYSGFAPDTADAVVLNFWSTGFPEDVVEKPCGPLGWCPYGPLVEQFPLDAEDTTTWHALREPEGCMVFGHMCPAFFVSEPLADLDAVLENMDMCEECRIQLERKDAEPPEA